MKRIFICLLALCLLLCGCSAEQPARTQYTATFLDLFDTVTSVVGFGETEEAFQAQAQAVHDDLLFYHRLFDIYNDYDGINNLKTINDQAGIAPVSVDPAIIRLLTDCRQYYDLTGGKVNAAMGSVLQLWHDARNDGIRDPANAKLPERSALAAAAQHMDFDSIVIDEAAGTVFITDPLVQLDVGAIAKGWATQKAADAAPEGMLISVGGNVCATGPKDDQGTAWVIGIQNPDGSGSNVHTIYVKSGCVVTSGDYQRTYRVDGKQYHHIIDPETGMPSAYWRSVTVVAEDSALADALSTALFLLPLEEGQALAERCGVQAFWIDANAQEFMTPGFREMIKR